MSTLQPPDEPAIISAAVKGDNAAFATLYDRYVERIYRHVRYLVPSQPDAEDITQTVFVKAWGSIGRYRSTGAPFIAWLNAIARNLVADYYRARKHIVPLQDQDIVDDPRSGPEMMVEASLTQRDLRDAISRLKGEKQTVLFMRFIDGMGYSEIAGILKKSEGAVRVIQFRALKELKELLDRQDKGR